MSLSDLAASASAVIAALSALVAAAAIYFPWRLQQNNELLMQAVLSLDRAYKALSNDGKNVKPPIADRLNWLTCARHIESYKAVKAQISTKLHRLLCEEHEEFWRHHFYLCLDIPNIQLSSYYSEQPAPNRRPGIEPRSALIIYAFTRWPENKLDPIDAGDVKRLMREYEPLRGNIGLRDYIGTFSQFRDET